MSNSPEKRLTSNDPEPTTPEPAPRPTLLRRWSVAELIARAVPRPPAEGLAH
jgi:hypothetical protein